MTIVFTKKPSQRTTAVFCHLSAAYKEGRAAVLKSPSYLSPCIGILRHIKCHRRLILIIVYTQFVNK